MTGIPQNNFAALEQERMIIGRVSCEASLNRQRPDGAANRIKSYAINESKARMPGSQAAE